jgi:hypothetical protein
MAIADRRRKAFEFHRAGMKPAIRKNAATDAATIITCSPVLLLQQGRMPPVRKIAATDAAAIITCSPDLLI